MAAIECLEKCKHYISDSVGPNLSKKDSFANLQRIRTKLHKELDYTLRMTHAKLLVLVGYLWCTISTFVL